MFIVVLLAVHNNNNNTSNNNDNTNNNIIRNNASEHECEEPYVLAKHRQWAFHQVEKFDHTNIVKV